MVTYFIFNLYYILTFSVISVICRWGFIFLEMVFQFPNTMYFEKKKKKKKKTLTAFII